MSSRIAVIAVTLYTSTARNTPASARIRWHCKRLHSAITSSWSPLQDCHETEQRSPPPPTSVTDRRGHGRQREQRKRGDRDERESLERATPESSHKKSRSRSPGERRRTTAAPRTPSAHSTPARGHDCDHHHGRQRDGARTNPPPDQATAHTRPQQRNERRRRNEA